MAPITPTTCNWRPTMMKLSFTAAAIAVALTAMPLASNANATGLIVPELVETVDPDIFVLPKMSCRAAKKKVKNAGYKKVRKIECNGSVYTFKGKKNGIKYAIAINATTGNIWTI